jgi:hypothetical protein
MEGMIWLRRWGLVVALTLVPTTVFGDIGLPMAAVFVPPAWLALVPIILIEAAVGIRWFRVPARRAIVGQAIANGVSTVVGLPITWATLAFIELRCCAAATGLDSLPRRLYAVTVQAPWLMPYDDDLRWMVPVSIFVLAVPFCLMSVATESIVLRCVLGDLPTRAVWVWALWANAASYAFLLGLILLAEVWPAPFEPLFRLLAPVTDAMIRKMLS